MIIFKYRKEEYHKKSKKYVIFISDNRNECFGINECISIAV